MAPINIELVDNELAVVFMNSKKAEVRKANYGAQNIIHSMI